MLIVGSKVKFLKDGIELEAGDDTGYILNGSIPAGMYKDNGPVLADDFKYGEVVYKDATGKLFGVKFMADTGKESVFGFRGANLMEYVEPTASEKKNAKKISINISRKNGKTLFQFKIDKKILKLYEAQPHEIRESEKWKGLKFYYSPELTGSEKYKALLSQFDLFDDYGSDFYRSGKLNIAWIRTVDGEGEIVINDYHSFAELSYLITNVSKFIKAYFEEYMRDYKISGHLEFEV